MGGEGFISGMISSLKNNRSLINKRSSFNERRKMYLDVERAMLRKRNATQQDHTEIKSLINQRVKRRKWIDVFSIVIAVLVIVLLFIWMESL